MDLNMKQFGKIVCIFSLMLLSYSTYSEEKKETEGVGYATVEEAREALKAKPKVNVIKNDEGWTVITDPSTSTEWSFTPEGYYAYPAVVKRQIEQSNKQNSVTINALCQTEKDPCMQLIQDFKKKSHLILESLKKPSNP
jgi:hypothetical protein